MGWYYESYSRSELITQLTEPRPHSTCIKHCCVGNVLWTVWKPNDDKRALGAENWIGCDLMARAPDGMWGHKPIGEESCHPFYYSCPLSYLELAPVANETWRGIVQDYHAQQSAKRQLRRLARAK